MIGNELKENRKWLSATGAIKRWVGLAICLLMTAIVLTPAKAKAQDATPASAPPVVVGRVFYIDGDLLRYVPDIKDWEAVVNDAPFGTDDTLYSGTTGRAELILPNETWIRIGSDTQIQFINLADDTTEADMASGMGRFFNKSSNAVIKVTSDFGYVLADPGAVFDFYVGDNSAELVPVRGKVSFVHSATNTRYDTQAGQPSILADNQQVSSGEGAVDPDWDQWNANRDAVWAEKYQPRAASPSVEYLPASIQYNAPILDEQGVWERINYEGSVRVFWRPRHVEAGWAPFTAGHWVEWRGDQTWIPDESFGYITHHYGNWVFVGGNWCWAPPVARVRVGLPLLDVGFCWNPGRVSWIHRDAYVGWVPLAPRERYYGHHRWGDPREVIVTSPGFSVSLSIGSFAYASHAIIINQHDYWGHRDYRKVRRHDIDRTTIINNYYAAPVINNTVINNYSGSRQRFQYSNVEVREKPHNTVVRRIERNDQEIKKRKHEKASDIKRQVNAIPESRPRHEVRIEQPKSTKYMVPVTQVNRPRSEIKLEQKEVKKPGKGHEGRPVLTPGRPGEKARPEVRPGEKQPRPGEGRITPGTTPGRVRPAERPQERPGASSTAPGQIKTPRKERPARPNEVRKAPDVSTERVQPRPQSQEKTGGTQGEIKTPRKERPARPNEVRKAPDVSTERVQPRPQSQEKTGGTQGEIKTPRKERPARPNEVRNAPDVSTERVQPRPQSQEKNRRHSGRDKISAQRTAN